MERRSGSVMSQNIHMRPSGGRGGVPVKRCVSVGKGVKASVPVGTSLGRGMVCRLPLPASRASSEVPDRMRNMTVW